MQKNWIFKYRGYLPVIPGLILIFFSNLSRNSIIVSIFFVILGEFIRIYSVAYTGKETRSNKTKAETLISDGPYSMVRNPIYLGNFFIGLGFIFLFNVWMPYIILLYIFFFSVEYGIIISVEEKFLFEKFGDKYKKYKESVAIILPIHKRYSGEKIIPDFNASFKSERDTFITILIVYLLTCVVNIIEKIWLHG